MMQAIKKEVVVMQAIKKAVLFLILDWVGRSLFLIVFYSLVLSLFPTGTGQIKF